MNQSWYDAHMKMRRRDQALHLDKHSCNTIGNEQETDDLDAMMHTFTAADLQNRVFAMQQELYTYHNMLDEIEKLKAYNKQLECQSIDLLQERCSHKNRLKKDARDTLESLKKEIVVLKTELAQSKAEEDCHNSKMQSMLGEKRTLEETVKALQESVRVHVTKEFFCLPIMDTYQITNEYIMNMKYKLLTM
mmetsp:Transcript_34206/g.51629  ORF Transcript_34206/g.51629 Transcript_34206/m.51629 type:complete len:191 (+) Transcript_34206:27-599(+)